MRFRAKPELWRAARVQRLRLQPASIRCLQYSPFRPSYSTSRFPGFEFETWGTQTHYFAALVTAAFSATLFFFFQSPMAARIAS
jgi:hypothetical protein